MNRLFAFFAALLVSAITLSGTSLAAPANVPISAPFEAVSLEGGGDVIIRRGSSHRVRVVRGDPAALEIVSTPRNGLKIRCRPNACRGATPQIEVTAPAVRALAVRGGGRIAIERGFAPQEEIALAVKGGGKIDSSQLESTTVAASVTGGGDIITFARSTLAASVRGGGLVRYLGDPRIATSINGGGAVRAASSSAR